MAAVGGQYTEFYGGFMFVQRVYNLCQIDDIITDMSVHDLFGDRRIFKSKHLVVG